MTTNKPQLVLGSTSPFRKELLQRLTAEFSTVSPDLDETRLDNETPEQLVFRLAEGKARAAADGLTNALVIGSDQVAVLDNQVLGKPHTHDKAIGQLQAASGRHVRFLTGLCLYNTETGKAQVEVVPFDVVFRKLSTDMIDAYLKREQPYNCAGSFKSEGLGSVLFERLDGDDPTALIGLPLIRLIRMLENEGIDLLSAD